MKKKQVVEQIVEAVLEENIMSKDVLTARITPIISIWIRESKPVAVPEGKAELSEKLNRMQKAINFKSEERIFLSRELQKVLTKPELNEMYERLDAKMVELGHK